MTKTVTVPGKRQRAGEGGRPVRVRVQGRSLLSRQGKSRKGKAGRRAAEEPSPYPGK